MRGELELGYLGVEVPDPSSLTAYFGEVIGLAPGEPGVTTTHTPQGVRA